MPAWRWKTGRSTWRFDVNVEHGVYISPRVLTPEILEHPVWGATPFLKAVQRESLPL